MESDRKSRPTLRTAESDLSHKAVFQVTAAALYDAPAPFQNFGLGIAVIAAFGVGAALYWLVERPFLRLRDRLDGPSRSPLDAGASVAATPG